MKTNLFSIIVFTISFCFISIVTSAQEAPGSCGSDIDSAILANNGQKIEIRQELTNYPNPVITSTTIKYSLPVDGSVLLDVYNAAGQKITTLFNGNRKAGTYTQNFSVSNIPSGFYICRLYVIADSKSSLLTRKIKVTK